MIKNNITQLINESIDYSMLLHEYEQFFHNIEELESFEENNQNRDTIFHSHTKDPASLLHYRQIIHDR